MTLTTKSEPYKIVLEKSWYDDSCEMMENSFVIAQKNEDAGTVRLVGSISPCRDNFLHMVFTHFNCKGETLTIALIMRKDVTEGKLANELLRLQAYFQKHSGLVEIIRNQMRIVQCVFTDTEVRPVLLFTVTAKQYTHPLSFWAFTDKVRHTLTGYSKINYNDSTHQSAKYFALLNTVESYSAYKSHNTWPPKVPYTEEQFTLCSSPATCIYAFSQIEDIMLSLYSGIHKSFFPTLSGPGNPHPYEGIQRVLAKFIYDTANNFFSFYPFEYNFEYRLNGTGYHDIPVPQKGKIWLAYLEEIIKSTETKEVLHK